MWYYELFDFNSYDNENEVLRIIRFYTRMITKMRYYELFDFTLVR